MFIKNYVLLNSLLLSFVNLPSLSVSHTQTFSSDIHKNFFYYHQFLKIGAVKDILQGHTRISVLAFHIYCPSWGEIRCNICT